MQYEPSHTPGGESTRHQERFMPCGSRSLSDLHREIKEPPLGTLLLCTSQFLQKNGEIPQIFVHTDSVLQSRSWVVSDNDEIL